MTKAAKKRKRKHALPAEATDDERLVACAKRLYTGTNAKGETVCYLSWHPRYGRDGRRLPLSVPEREFLEAAIGRKLKEKQPEFSRGPGKKPGSKNKSRKDEDRLLRASIHTRTWRDNKEANERAKKRGKWTVAIIPDADGRDEYVRLDELGPQEEAPSEDSSNAPIGAVDLYDERFEFKNYYTGDLAKEQKMDATWHAERNRQKRERWLAKKR
jgi:hypothetical protein